MEKPEYFPTIFQSIILVALYRYVFTLVPLLFLISLAPLFNFNPNDILVGATAQFFGFGLLIFWIKRRYRLEYSPLISLKQLRFTYIIPAIMVVAGVTILFSELDNLLKSLFAGPDVQTIIQAVSWRSFLVLAILTPVMEELLFRGIILKGLLKHHPPYRAVMVSSLLFGFFYLNTWQFWAFIGWGVIAGWWYYRTRSLALCILGRVLLEFLSLIAVDLLGLEIRGFTTGSGPMVLQPLWFDCVGAFLLFLGLFLMGKLFHKEA